MGIVEIVGVAGFVIALGSVAWQIRDYFPRLQMSVVCFRYIPDTCKKTALVFVRLAFVNPSSRTKTVGHIEVNIQSIIGSVHQTEVLEEYSEDSHDVFYRLATDKMNRCSMPTSESLQDTLDIPPHQSVSKWYALAVAADENDTEPRQVGWMRFDAYSYQLKVHSFPSSKPIASCGKQIVLAEKLDKPMIIHWPFYETHET